MHILCISLFTYFSFNVSMGMMGCLWENSQGKELARIKKPLNKDPLLILQTSEYMCSYSCDRPMCSYPCDKPNLTTEQFLNMRQSNLVRLWISYLQIFESGITHVHPIFIFFCIKEIYFPLISYIPKQYLWDIPISTYIYLSMLFEVSFQQLAVQLKPKTH